MSLGEQSTTDTLGEMQGKGDKFTRLALIEKKRQTDLNDAITYIMNETDKYRTKAKKSAIDVMNIHVLTPNPAYSRADGVNIGKEAQMVTTKTLHILEAKLNTLLQRKSEIQNHVKKMKETINHYRLLRMQTDAAHARFEQTLVETKGNIEGHLAEATKVMEERDRVLEKKDQLERVNVEEQQRFQEEYEEMGKFIKKQNDALENGLLQERKADRMGTTLQKTDEGSNLVSDLSLEQEIEMAKKVGSLTSFMQSEQSSLSDLKEKISSYESMFEQLKKMTGVESLEEMVSNYIDHEEEMFSLYNFIQAMNTEIDMVKEATLETEEAIVKFREDQQDQDQQRRSVIDELQQRLTSTLEITRQLVEDNAVQQESISQISKKVSSVFFKLQCDQMDAKGSNISRRYNSGSVRPDSKIALLTSQGVTESNVLDYLGCIEQRAVDIITEYLHLLNTRPDLNNGIITTVQGLGSSYRINSLTGGGPRSPTPGPSTPMTRVHKRDPIVDLDELADDDFLLSLENDPSTTNMNNTVGNNTNVMPSLHTHSSNVPTANATALNTAMNTHLTNPAANAGVDSDSKPVDLKAFKNKLQKKLGLKDGGAQGNSGPLGTGGMMTNVSGISQGRKK
ncbi:hypothetical protein EON65_00510 [archaeon]|nr:MAG: hypothetical protein EON65_00510 [archaeon]